MNRNTRIALGAGVLALLAGAVGPWATVPDDLRSDANGTYMIDVAVERS